MTRRIHLVVLGLLLLSVVPVIASDIDDYNVSGLNVKGLGKVTIRQGAADKPAELIIEIVDETGKPKVGVFELKLQDHEDHLCGDTVLVRVYSNTYPPADPPTPPQPDPTKPPVVIGPGTDFGTVALTTPVETPKGISKAIVPFWITIRGCHPVLCRQILLGFEFDIYRGETRIEQLVSKRPLDKDHPILDHKASMDGGDLGTRFGTGPVEPTTDQSSFCLDIPALGTAPEDAVTGGMGGIFGAIGYAPMPGDRWAMTLTIRTYIICDRGKGVEEVCAVIDWCMTVIYELGNSKADPPIPNTAGAFFCSVPDVRAPNADDESALQTARDDKGGPFNFNAANIVRKQ